MNRQTSVYGKHLLLKTWVNNGNSQSHIYYADIEKIGEIRGKLPLTPIFTTDLSSSFEVSGTTNMQCVTAAKMQINCVFVSFFSL